MNKSPIDYITRIEQMFDRCRKDRLGRFSVEWGVWSREMNIELKTDKANTSDMRLQSRYNFVFVFWVEMSKCLEQTLPDFGPANRAREQALTKDPMEFIPTHEERTELLLGGRWKF